MSKTDLKNKVLIIAYHFPPHTGGGVFRPLKFAKYLPEFGWQPIVLAAEPTAYDPLDHTLLGQLPDSAIVHRVTSVHPKDIEAWLKPIWSLFWKLRLRTLADAVQPYKLLRWLPPDPYIGWVRPALRKARELIAKYQPDVIFTTSPPHSTQLVGLRLKQTGLPWIADFRDPWERNPFTHFPISGLRKLNSRWERQTLQKADAVVCVTETMRRWASEGCATAQVVCIDNGFDPDDFTFQVPKQNRQSFTLAYTGSLYGIRRLDHVLKAIDLLIQSGHIKTQEIRFRFMGRDGTGCTKPYYDQPWFEFFSYDSHEIAIQVAHQSDATVLLVPPQGSYITSSKLFDYLQIPNPILAIAPEDSDAAAIIRKTQTGIVADPCQPEEIAGAILELFTAWRRGTLQIKPNKEAIARYDRRHLTGQLAQLFDQTVSHYEK